MLDDGFHPSYYHDTLYVLYKKTDMSIEKIFAEVFAIPESAVVDGLVLSDIPSWDSLAHMMLITRLEDAYQIQLTSDEIADMKSVGAARSALRAHGAAP